MAGDLGVRYLFILGPHGERDYKAGEAFIMAMNLQSLIVFFSLSEDRPFTAAEIRDHLTAADDG